MAIPKRERVGLFFNEMNNLPPVATRRAAIRQVKKAINDIEDEYYGSPLTPQNYEKAERMDLPSFSIQGAWKITDKYCRVDLSQNYLFFHTDGSMACVARKDAKVKWAKAGLNSFLAPKKGEIHPDKEEWKETEHDISVVPPPDPWNIRQSNEPDDWVDVSLLGGPEVDPPDLREHGLWASIKRFLRFGKRE